MTVTALYGVLAALLGCLVVTVIAVRRILFVVTVRGSSMEPTYRPGDRVLARRAGLTEVQVGDVVILGVREPVKPEEQGSWWPGAELGDGTFQVPGTEWIIKRAAAVPGDPVPREAFAALAQVSEAAVPEGKLVVQGDSPHSADSRMHGYYDGDRLAGVVLRRLSGRRRDTPLGVHFDTIVDAALVGGTGGATGTGATGTGATESRTAEPGRLSRSGPGGKRW